MFEGVPTCGSDHLLNDVMRDELGFGGLVVSDCGAVQNMCNGKIATLNSIRTCRCMWRLASSRRKRAFDSQRLV